MDCCTPKKDTGKNEPENAKQMEKQNTEKSHGGCCGGGNMKLHLLLMIVLFALVWYFTKR